MSNQQSAESIKQESNSMSNQESSQPAGSPEAQKIVVANWSDLTEVRRVDAKTAALYDQAFVFPLSAEGEILEVVRQRAALKKAYDDSMKLVYELVNKLTREGRR